MSDHPSDNGFHREPTPGKAGGLLGERLKGAENTLGRPERLKTLSGHSASLPWTASVPILNLILAKTQTTPSEAARLLSLRAWYLGESPGFNPASDTSIKPCSLTRQDRTIPSLIHKKRSDRSTAMTSLVRSPTEISSTPVSAMARTRSSVTPPDASSRARPAVTFTASLS
jgi:hypothetical protein